MSQTKDDDLRARIARDLDAGADAPNTELAPPARSAEVEALLAAGGNTIEQAVILAHAGQREDALQILSQVLEKDPTQAPGWLLMAALADNPLIAQACLEQALMMDPAYAPAQAGLAWMTEHPTQVPVHLLQSLVPPVPELPSVEAPTEMLPVAEALVEEAVIAPPSVEEEAGAEKDPLATALALSRAGQNDEAVQVLVETLEENPHLTPAWVLLSAVVDNALEARACLEQALTVDPASDLAQAGLAWMDEHPAEVPTHLITALITPPAGEVEMAPIAEAEIPPAAEMVAVEVEAPPAAEMVAAAVEDDLRARIARDLKSEEPDRELAPPPPSAEVAALLARGGDPIELAMGLARAGRNEDALQVLSKALEDDPSSAQGWVLMGALTNNALIARSCLEQALQLDPNNREALDGLRWMDRHPDEVPAFILGEARPSRIPPGRELVEAAEVIARKWEAELAAAAVDDLRARIARDLEREEPDRELAPPPPSAEVEALLAEGGDPIELATGLARAGRNEDALQVLSRALEKDPSTVRAWVLMGALADKPVVARACLEQARLLDPDNSEALDGLRWMDQHPDQVPVFILGEARPPKPPPIELRPPPSPPREAEELVAWAVAAIQEEKFDDAHAYLSRAVDLDPQNVAAWLRMAAIGKTPDDVRTCLKRVLEIDPYNTEALTSLQRLELQAAPVWPGAEVAAAPAPSVPVVEAPRPFVSSIPLPGVRREIAPADLTRPLVQHIPSRRRQQLQRLASPAYPFERPAEPSRRRGCRSWFLMSLILVTMLLVAGVATVGLANAGGLFQAATPTPTLQKHLARLWDQSEAALAQGDWATAIQLLGQVQTLDPQREGLADRLYQAHLNHGLALVTNDQLEAAIVQFDTALAIRPADPAASLQRRLASLYLAGRHGLEAGDYGTAAARFAEVYFLDPTYRNVATLLYLARCRFASELLAQGKYEAAIEQYELALQVVPAGADATSGLAHAQALRPTPTPTPRPTPALHSRQRIEISIAQQRFRAYQDDALVFDLVCSTGEPARPTRTGTFKVLDKIPMAYSSVWDLKMPWWLGIYWSGSIENGIHGLPTLSNGQTLWAGFLGRPVSFGCIILDTADARRVYDWAQIGAPVIITY